MDIDAHTLGIVGGGGFGGFVLAFVLPVANKLVDRWMKSADREDSARQKLAETEAQARALMFDAQRHTIERVADASERATQVMERMMVHVEQTNDRLDRIEAHLGVQGPPAPKPTAPVESVNTPVHLVPVQKKAKG